MEGVAGTWIGVGGWRTYRLSLDADGSAVLAVVYSYDEDDETRLYRTDHWLLNDQRLTATFEPKFLVLPKELVRRVVEYAFHVGDY